MTVTHLKKPRLSLAGLASLLLVVFASCDDEIEDPKVTGEWTGEVLFISEKAAINLVLTEDDAGAVTGTVTFSVFGFEESGPVTGTHNYPDVTLEFAVTAGKRAAEYVGKLVAEDRMEGTFSINVLDISEPATLTRKGT